MKKQFIIALSLIAFICICRTVPHVDNFSPMIVLALFSGRILSKPLAAGVLVLGMCLSDVLLSNLFGYPVFGAWSLFTYSALLAVLFAGTFLPKLENRFTLGLVAVLASNLGFWVWTNFGTWLTSGMYSMHMSGLMTCFAAGIPFLQHSMMSALFWYVILVAGLRTLSFYQKSAVLSRS